jgi:hypothetical protein
MMVDDNLGVRYIHNDIISYGQVRRVIYACMKQSTQHVTFLELAPRKLVEEKRTVATVTAAENDTIFVDLLASLTHIVKFVQHPTQPLGHYLALKLWATEPGWETR